MILFSSEIFVVLLLWLRHLLVTLLTAIVFKLLENVAFSALFWPELNLALKTCIFKMFVPKTPHFFKEKSFP